MIDEKKMQEAANNYIGHEPEVDEGCHVSARRDAFKDGIAWFKKNLWHSSKERPQQNDPIVTKWWDEVDGVSYEIDSIGSSQDWSVYCFRNNIMAWCYVSDIQ